MVSHLVEQMMEKFIKAFWRNDKKLWKWNSAEKCAAADRTGHAILHSFGQALKHNTEFLLNTLR